jgi:hypothetical protein
MSQGSAEQLTSASSAHRYDIIQPPSSFLPHPRPLPLPPTSGAPSSARDRRSFIGSPSDHHAPIHSRHEQSMIEIINDVNYEKSQELETSKED